MKKNWINSASILFENENTDTFLSDGIVGFAAQQLKNTHTFWTDCTIQLYDRWSAALLLIDIASFLLVRCCSCCCNQAEGPLPCISLNSQTHVQHWFMARFHTKYTYNTRWWPVTMLCWIQFFSVSFFDFFPLERCCVAVMYSIGQSAFFAHTVTHTNAIYFLRYVFRRFLLIILPVSTVFACFVAMLFCCNWYCPHFNCMQMEWYHCALLYCSNCDCTYVAHN